MLPLPFLRTTKTYDIPLDFRYLLLQFDHTIIRWERSCIVRAYVQVPMAACPNPEILSTLCSFVNTSAAVDVNSRAAGDWGPSVLLFLRAEVFPYSPRLACGLARGFLLGPNLSLWLSNTSLHKAAANLSRCYQPGELSLGIWNRSYLLLAFA